MKPRIRMRTTWITTNNTIVIIVKVPKWTKKAIGIPFNVQPKIINDKFTPNFAIRSADSTNYSIFQPKLHFHLPIIRRIWMKEMNDRCSEKRL